MKLLPADLFVPQNYSYDFEHELYEEDSEIREEEDFLAQIDQMIKNDVKKLEKVENIVIKPANMTNSTFKTTELTTLKSVEITTNNSIEEPAIGDLKKNLTSFIALAANSTPVALNNSLEKTSTESYNVTELKVNATSGLNETEREIILDEVLIDLDEPHAFIGSSSSRFNPELTILFVNLIIVLITNFTN